MGRRSSIFVPTDTGRLSPSGRRPSVSESGDSSGRRSPMGRRSSIFVPTDTDRLSPSGRRPSVSELEDSSPMGRRASVFVESKPHSRHSSPEGRSKSPDGRSGSDRLSHWRGSIPSGSELVPPQWVQHTQAFATMGPNVGLGYPLTSVFEPAHCPGGSEEEELRNDTHRLCPPSPLLLSGPSSTMSPPPPHLSLFLSAECTPSPRLLPSPSSTTLCVCVCCV